MSQISLVLKIHGGIIAVAGVVTYLSYKSDIRAAREQVMSGSQAIETTTVASLAGQKEKVRSEVRAFLKQHRVTGAQGGRS